MDAARVLDVLALARAFVAAGWSRKSYARNRYSRPRLIEDDSAIRFCVIGAMERAVFELTPVQRLSSVEEEASAVCERLRRYCECVLLAAGYYASPSGLTNWNDLIATKRQVLALFDQAAARVGKR